MSEINSPIRVVVPPECAGQRLDAFLAASFAEYSRVRLRRAITAGGVSVDAKGCKPSQRVQEGQEIVVSLPEPEPSGPEPEPIPVDVLYEDDHIAAVNKPAGMVVHPGKGHWRGTLASALAHHFQQLSSAGGATRPGIVHRLDRDTSGVLVVAKNDEAHYALSEQFQNRTTDKRYLAIVLGVPDRDADWINEPIGPHPYHRERMAIRHDHPDARDARTYYEVQERFQRFSLVRVRILTGRTHQIRIHLSHVKLPVLCDKLYGGRSRIDEEELRGQRTWGAPRQDDSAPDWLLERQALHAERLSVTHPVTNERLEFVAPLPDDLQNVIRVLRDR